LRNVSVLNSSINDSSNARLWRSFTIDYDYDYVDAVPRRRDIRTRCQALIRKPSRASYVRLLVVQWDAALGSHFGTSARSMCRLVCRSMMILTKLEALQIHTCAHNHTLGRELSAHAHRFPFSLKRLTTSMSVQHRIERFLAHQPSIVFFEANRHERLKSATQMKPGEDIPSHLMPALRVIYTSGYRAAKLLENRNLHTVEITNIATPSTYNPPGHVHKEPSARVEHLCANFDLFPEQLASFILYWGITPSSIRFLHLSGTFPQYSVYPQILASLTLLEGFEWSAKRKSKTFPRPQGFVTPTADYYQAAVRECSDCCPTLNAIIFVAWSDAREVWRASATIRRRERMEGRLDLTVQDGSGKRWQLVSSNRTSWRTRPSSSLFWGTS